MEQRDVERQRLRETYDLLKSDIAAMAKATPAKREQVRLLNYCLRAAPLVRAKVKITVKNTVCEESSVSAYGVFDWQFDFASHEWSCSE